MLPQAKPVILQIIPELGPGGAEQGCIDVAAELVASGAQSIIVSNGGSRVGELARSGVTHINLPVKTKNPLGLWRNVGSLRKIIRRYNVNIVHARSRAPAWSAWRACQKTDARFMTTCHAPYKIENNWKRFYNGSIAKGERVIAISETIADYLKANYGLDDSIIRVIHRGVALEKFHPASVTPERLIALSQKWRLPDGANIVMLPGRLTRWKGHHVLIEAINRLGRRDIFCLLIGADQGRSEYRRELEASINEKNLQGKVRIVDHCQDMPAAYMLATVVVSASTEPEGFGRIAVEAQAMGRPVIASDHGGSRETVRRGETGWLVKPGDPAELAKAIEEALSLNQFQRAVLATRAMAHVAEHFTRERMTDKTLDVYAELLRGKAFAPPEKDHVLGAPRFHARRMRAAAE